MSKKIKTKWQDEDEVFITMIKTHGRPLSAEEKSVLSLTLGKSVQCHHEHPDCVLIQGQFTIPQILGVVGTDKYAVLSVYKGVRNPKLPFVPKVI